MTRNGTRSLFDDGKGHGGGAAKISGCGRYRYTLTRKWGDGPCVAFLMFNPSTADGTRNDSTIRKCIGFAKCWGYGRMVVVNLYAIRSTDPSTVSRCGAEAIGGWNQYWINMAAKEAQEVICAWGCAEHARHIDAHIASVVAEIRARDTPLRCLGYRKDGHPRHPGRLAYATPRELFVARPTGGDELLR